VLWKAVPTQDATNPVSLPFLLPVNIYIAATTPVFIHSAHNFKNDCCIFVWLEQAVTALDRSAKNLQAASKFQAPEG
jgi:hypothetical protein